MSEPVPSYYSITPASVRYCKDLEPNAKLLYGEITALCSKEGYCWATNDYFAKLYEVDVRTVKRWISSLEKNKFVFVHVEKSGFFTKRKICISEEVKKFLTKGQKCHPRGDKNVTLEGTKMSPNSITPITNKPSIKGIACKTGIAEALPSSIEDGGNGIPRIIKPSTTRKFKRSKVHQDVFEWLLSLELTDHQNSLSEDAISVLSHEYSKKRLEDTYSHMMHKISEGFEPKSRIAFFKHLLKKEHCPITSNCEINSESAKNYASEVGWHSLVIKDKYVEDKNFAGKDIPLNMDDEEFFRQLVKLHESVTGT